jgi:hypothetical protein
MIDLTSNSFPSGGELKTYTAVPIVLRPITDSPERFVIGVIAYNQNELHLEKSNALNKLECLYGANAYSTIALVDAVLTELSSDLINDFEASLRIPEFLFSGIEFGVKFTAEGMSAIQVAIFYMSTLSSLYGQHEVLSTAPVSKLAERAIRSDELPVLVLEYINSARPELSKFFSEEIQSRKIRKSKFQASRVHIDFAGSRVVANFGTLNVSQTSASFDHLKRRLWDLKIHRDSKEVTNLVREHELYVHFQTKHSPQTSSGQSGQMNEAIHSLTAEADIEDIRLRSYNMTLPQTSIQF